MAGTPGMMAGTVVAGWKSGGVTKWRSGGERSGRVAKAV